ncbi:hypothetical protein AB0958_41555 [Streptomyces sp. NPDC006655]|uniref:hypothetical protein n=1 Tax=Streptomyces sp. NPDC006655 TaxID=3156898 RepID=UPI003456E79F
MDNARWYARERGIALALQRAQLPPTQISHATVEMAARYRTSGGDAEVGGYRFDVISLPGARVGLVVGHGINASATMGPLRPDMPHPRTPASTAGQPATESRHAR